MSITEEDLQFMADALWEDSLLPSNDCDPDLSRLLSADEHVEGAANLSDALLERKPKVATKTPSTIAGKPTAKATHATANASASTSQGKTKIDWKRSAKPAINASEANSPAPKETPAVTRPKIDTKGKSKEKPKGKSSVAVGDAAKSKDKTKMPPPQSTSPLSDLYLSSLPASLIKPKTGSKLSKSMKGASQNEKQDGPGNELAPEADMLDKSDAAAGLDLYGIPMSPTSNQPIQGTTQKTKTMSPATSVAKMTSPLGLIPASDKRRLKPQKRVAKRSFLDAPETPEEETKVRSTQVKLPPKAAHAPPAPKQTAKPKRKPSVGKGREKAKEKDKETEKPATATKPKLLETNTKGRQATRSFLVAKQLKKEDSPYDIPASMPDVPHVEEITKKLRPRVEKPSIIISSDSDTNYSDDDDFSDSAFTPATWDTTIMTTPEHAVEDFTLPKLQYQQPDRLTASAVEAGMGKSAGTSRKIPSQRAAIEATERPKKAQKLSDDADMHSAASPGLGDTTSTYSAVKEDLGRLVSSHGPETFVSEQDSVAQMQRQDKRQRSPTKKHGNNRQQKRQKLGKSVTTTHDQDETDADTDHNLLQSQGSSSKVVQSVVASDPFVGNLGEERLEQSQFTSKLLRSAAEPVPGMEQWESGRPTTRQPRYSMAINTPLPAKRDASVSHTVSAESKQIAREMMQLLANGRRADPDQVQTCGPESAKDIWLNETDPYKETTQVMSYVCNTLLRFLKSKESAVEDVATEYQQRGGAVLVRIKELHGKEKNKFALEFENKRQQSLELFEEACRGVSKIAGSLERVSLVPAINDVLADDTVSRLRALQAEIA
ncbi:hypothetical protein F503_04735 [Ophiostoma piceae UAMH 11346]|uniref:Uncharacterized protein n=1 Tax=Ophiostoma piceae (strain UAMH 11346) TaxID=1262450 RepID=S3CU69_OPHP1|nr:hypothetical protein F503_04735 [Ophiostoma piceae UAMH 11346]